MNGRAWTKQEDRFLGQHFKAMTAKAMGSSLQRTVFSVRMRLEILRLKKQPRVIDHRRLAKFICAKHKLGWTDSETARAWTSKHPDQPVSREWIRELRRLKLRLPHNAFSEHRRRCVAKKTREQLRKAGLPSIGHLRREAFKDFCRRQGWAQVTRPRLVQILNLLYERGPHTREQIAQAIGMPWKGTRNGKHPASRHSLYCNAPGGSATAVLMRMKLVVRLGRNVRTGPGKGQAVNCYAIAPGVVRGKTETRVAS